MDSGRSLIDSRLRGVGSVLTGTYCERSETDCEPMADASPREGADGSGWTGFVQTCLGGMPTPAAGPSQRTALARTG